MLHELLGLLTLYCDDDASVDAAHQGMSTSKHTPIEGVAHCR